MISYNQIALHFVAAMATCAFMANPVGAELIFTEPSFENGGSTTMVKGTRYDEGGSGVTVDTLDTGTWWMHRVNNGHNGGLLEDKDSYIGFTGIPTGVTGEQFLTVSRSGERADFQYIADGGVTTGQVTFSIDYWAHEINAGDPVSGGGEILFQVIAFNDASTVTVGIKGIPIFKVFHPELRLKASQSSFL